MTVSGDFATAVPLSRDGLTARESRRYNSPFWQPAGAAFRFDFRSGIFYPPPKRSLAFVSPYSGSCKLPRTTQEPGHARPEGPLSQLLPRRSVVAAEPAVDDAGVRLRLH